MRAKAEAHADLANIFLANSGAGSVGEFSVFLPAATLLRGSETRLSRKR